MVLLLGLGLQKVGEAGVVSEVLQVARGGVGWGWSGHGAEIVGGCHDGHRSARLWPLPGSSATYRDSIEHYITPSDITTQALIFPFSISDQLERQMISDRTKKHCKQGKLKD